MNIKLSRRRFLQSTAAASVAGAASALPAAARPKKAGKKGACFVTREGHPWLDRTTQLKAEWLYSWGSERPATLPEKIEFCPMIWGARHEDKLAKRIDAMRSRVDSGELRHLMGFNEPDQHDQSNMTVERALELWPVLMDLGVPLVSPGCVHPDREWMREFMEGVERKNLRVDFVAVHSYGGPSAPALMKRLEKVYKEFGRRLWITEFAVGDWKAKSPEQNRHRPPSIIAFMKQVLPALDDASFVDRYAWFSAGQQSNALGTSALFDDAGELTRLGRVYAGWS